jgi:hypothetical protein
VVARKTNGLNKKAKESGDEIVRLASWGMLPQLEIGAHLDRLKFIITLPIVAIVAVILVIYQIPSATELRNSVSLVVGLAGVAISVWGIFKGMERLFLEERYQRKVVIYPSSYQLDDEKVLVTVINIGDPLIVRGVDLIVGWVEANRPISHVVGRGLLNFTVLGYAPLFAGCMPMSQGSIWRFREDDVKKGLLHIASWSKESLQSVEGASPEVYLVMTDRFLEYHMQEEEKRRGSILIRPIHGLISMCSLGDFNHLLAEAQADEGIKMSEMTMEFKGDLKSGAPGRMIRFTPPVTPSEQEYMTDHMQTLEKIVEKLDSIQKTLDEMSGKAKSEKTKK